MTIELSSFNHSIAHNALSGLIDLESLSIPPNVKFTGGDICFNSPFFGGEAVSAVLGANGLIAAEISRLSKRREIHHVGVNTRLAEASLLSFALQVFNDPKKSPEARPSAKDRTPASGFFKCKGGGEIYLHSSFPHYSQHSDAMLKLLKVLKVPADSAAIVKRIAEISAKELEDKIATAGLCGAMVRTPKEWDQSTAGLALSAVPVIEIIKMTDTHPTPSRKPSVRPILDGMKVLDLTRVLAGPSCAKHLSAYGAEVLHIRGKGLPHVESFITDTGIGKRSAYLNLKDEKDREVLQSLVKQSDVFSQGYRSGAMSKLGFGVDDVMDMNPNSIYVSINCYGHHGDWQKRPGWEQLAQVVTGMAVQQGGYQQGDSQQGDSRQKDETSIRPILQPSALNDYITGYLASLGVLLAKREQLLSGGGYLVRVSLCRTAMWVRKLGLRNGNVHARFPEGRELASFSQSFETAWGGMSALRPALSLSGESLKWLGPPYPLGHHSASFRD